MNDREFKKKYGPWALVTGGASGIGAGFASRLARLGIDLVLADIQTGAVTEHARALKGRFSVTVVPITVDLADPDFLKLIRAATRRIEIGLLVNNAGWGTAGEFMKTDPAEMRRTIAVNCTAPMALAREFGPAMVERGRGGIIFVSSASALQVTPVLANYAATKAYSLVLAEAMWEELRSYGVDVLAICPGATDTPAFHKSGACIENVPGMPLMTPAEVVDEALSILGKRPSVVTGLINRVATMVISRLLTRKMSVVFSGKNMRKLFPDV
jgi:short-subunit dehydrogenase